VDAPNVSASLRGPLARADQWTRDEGALDLWLAPLGALAAEDLAVLSGDERERVERQRRAATPTFGAARAVLRRVLARYVGAAPEALVFRYGEYGRPALALDVALDFNLSHSGSLALIAVAHGARVGVDLQRVEPGRDLRALANRFFAEAEAASLLGLEGEALAREFFRLWCCKEAYVKALGTSIAELPSRSFRFELDVPPGAARLVSSGWDAPGSEPLRAWRFELLEAPDGFAAAVGWTGGARRLRAFGADRGAP
jgi:4'-phosphopantetheinyl transferase